MHYTTGSLLGQNMSIPKFSFDSESEYIASQHIKCMGKTDVGFHPYYQCAPAQCYRVSFVRHNPLFP